MARNRRPPLPALGTPLEPLYRAAVNKRNRDFDNGRRVTRLPIPVVSVGNISVGGTGKTPMVRWIINTLRDLGANPGIAMRGYGRKHAGVSDEQQEHADRLPDTPIAANPDRIAAIRELIEHHHADCAVLDDGFQHRFAARDLDIVLIDATRSPFADRCLPAGWLREPVESLARAHAIVITRSTLVEPHALSQLDRQLRRIAPDALVVRADHHWAALDTQFGPQPVSWLNGRPTIIACAIGNPDAFIAQARARGARVIDTIIRRDHHHWTRRDADRILSLARPTTRQGALLTTHKDWVKWRRLDDERLNAAAVRPIVEMSMMEEDAAALRDALQQVFKNHPNPVP